MSEEGCGHHDKNQRHYHCPRHPPGFPSRLLRQNLCSAYLLGAAIGLFFLVLLLGQTLCPEKAYFHLRGGFAR